MSKLKSPKSSAVIDVEKVAKLASLSLSQNEKKDFQKQLEEIISYISKLNSVNTQKVKPIEQITGLENIARVDETLPSLTQEEALLNAPKTKNGFIEVEAILDQ